MSSFASILKRPASHVPLKPSKPSAKPTPPVAAPAPVPPALQKAANIPKAQKTKPAPTTGTSLFDIISAKPATKKPKPTPAQRPPPLSAAPAPSGVLAPSLRLKKSKLSSLKKRLLSENAQRYYAANTSEITVSINGYVQEGDVDDDEEYDEILEDLTSSITAMTAPDETLSDLTLSTTATTKPPPFTLTLPREPPFTITVTVPNIEVAQVSTHTAKQAATSGRLVPATCLPCGTGEEGARRRPLCSHRVCCSPCLLCCSRRVCFVVRAAFALLFTPCSPPQCIVAKFNDKLVSGNLVTAGIGFKKFRVIVLNFVDEECLEDDEEFEEVMGDLCGRVEAFGKAVVSIPRTGADQGSAFVDFNVLPDAIKCVEELGKVVLAGVKLNVALEDAADEKGKGEKPPSTAEKPAKRLPPKYAALVSIPKTAAKEPSAATCATTGTASIKPGENEEAETVAMEMIKTLHEFQERARKKDDEKVRVTRNPRAI